MKIPLRTRRRMENDPEVAERWRRRLFVADLWLNCTDAELADFLWSEAMEIVNDRRTLANNAKDLDIAAPHKYASDLYIRTLTIYEHYNKPPICILRMLLVRYKMSLARVAYVRDLLPYCDPAIIAQFAHVDLPTVQLDIEMITVSWSFRERRESLAA